MSTTGGLHATPLETTLLKADIFLGSIFWGVDYYKGHKLVVCCHLALLCLSHMHLAVLADSAAKGYCDYLQGPLFAFSQGN